MQFGYCINASNHVAVLRSLSEKVLRGSQCKLRASVVSVFPGNFTTETQSITEFAQRNSFFRQTPERAIGERIARCRSLRELNISFYPRTGAYAPAGIPSRASRAGVEDFMLSPLRR